MGNVIALHRGHNGWPAESELSSLTDLISSAGFLPPLDLGSNSGILSNMDLGSPSSIKIKENNSNLNLNSNLNSNLNINNISINSPDDNRHRKQNGR